MASFRESIDALKEAGLADSEILEIMFESVDGQMITKKSSPNKDSGQELSSKHNDTTNETPTPLIEGPFLLSPLGQILLASRQIWMKRPILLKEL